MRKVIILVGLAVSGTWTASAAVARADDYAAAGPETFTTSDLAAGTGGADGGHLVVPNGPGPYPLVIASHGWSASADNQVGWAEHFASWGFVVAAPTFPNAFSPDANKDADIIAALVDLYAHGSGTPADGKVDPTRIALEGHSAGGLATTLAAVKLRPRAIVLFDPVDNNDAGKTALPSVCSPLLEIFADPSSCNNQSGWHAFATTSTGPLAIAGVVGSTHCDGENHARALCGSFCGGSADPQRQDEYARLGTAFLLAHVKDDAKAAATLTAAALAGDAELHDTQVRDGAGCGGDTTDAGPSPGDGGAPPSRDAGTQPPIDAGGGGRGGDASSPSGSDGGAAPIDDEPGPSAAGGCGCGVIDRAGARGGWAIALLAIASLVRRRHARG